MTPDYHTLPLLRGRRRMASGSIRRSERSCGKSISTTGKTPLRGPAQGDRSMQLSVRQRPRLRPLTGRPRMLFVGVIWG